MDAKVVKTFILGLLAVCLMTLLGLFYVWQHNRLITAGGDLATASEKLQELRTQNELLEAEYRTLRSSDGFADRAFSELNMKRPSSVDSIHME